MLTEATVHKVIEGMSVTCECELAVVSRAFLQALDCNSAEVACVRRVVSQDGGPSRHESVDQRHRAKCNNTALFWSSLSCDVPRWQMLT